MDMNPMQGQASQLDHKHILVNFLDSYLIQRDVRKTCALVMDDVYSLGTGVHEVAHNKVELEKLICDELEQIPDPIAYDLDSYHEKTVADDVFVCICDVTTHIQLDGQPPIHYSTRLTAGFRQVGGTYLAYHLHMSEPSSAQQEYEFFPLHYGEMESQKIDSGKQIELVELMKKMLPGGAMGGYVEPGFPLYFINDELLNWLGYTYDEFITENGQMMSNTIHPNDVATVEAVISKAFEAGNEYSVEYRMRKKDSTYIWVRDIGRKTIAHDGRVAMISIIADISNERLRERSFVQTIESMKRERRRTDRMTGLLNREPAEILIEQCLIREQEGALFFMDIDNFKLANDTKGHPAGDQILHSFSAHLRGIFPETAIIARMGGDEFVVFLPAFDDRDQLRKYAERVIAGAAHLTDDISLASKLGVSIGIAIAPEHGTELKTLYSNADKGLYFAKRNGKNRYSFYMQSSALPDMDELKPDLQTLRRMVQGVLIDKGAFMVEYETFNKICQFTLRNAQRLKQATQILLFTIQSEDNEDDLSQAKAVLEQSIRYGLRIGDLMMDFSTDQIAVLLVNCNEENAVRVAKRIIASYSDLGGHSNATVMYECGGVNEDTSS